MAFNMLQYSYGTDYDGDGDNDTECLNFTTETARVVLRVKLSLGAFTILANLLAIILIIASKKFRDILYRLVVYLMITDILQAIAICLALFPITVPDEEHPAMVKNSNSSWNGFCDATGFILMVTMWMGNIVIIWIVVHLLILGWREQRLLHNDKGKNTAAQLVCTPCSRWEILGLLFLFFGPFLIGWIPFVLPREMYGISGLWCWIKEVQHKCGDLRVETLIVVFVFFYGPLVLIAVFSFSCMILTIVLVCHGAVRRHGSPVTVDHHQRRMKEIIIALAYPMLYCTVCLLLLANRVYSVAHPGQNPNVPLWITHTVADPVRVMLPAIAFLLHPFVWRDLCNRGKPPSSIPGQKQEQPDQTSCVNGEEDSMEDNNLLIAKPNGNGTYGTYGTCDDDDRYLSGVVESR